MKAASGNPCPWLQRTSTHIIRCRSEGGNIHLKIHIYCQGSSKCTIISYLAELPKDVEQKVMIFVEVWFIPIGAGGCIIQIAETNISFLYLCSLSTVIIWSILCQSVHWKDPVISNHGIIPL